ncbi:hypothetical protein D8666_13260 [Ochrobactrum soli]|nr:hypothetical protein D8666_13260 [[Ochrobactrum] soli]
MAVSLGGMATYPFWLIVRCIPKVILMVDLEIYSKGEDSSPILLIQRSEATNINALNLRLSHDKFQDELGRIHDDHLRYDI